MIKVAGLNKLFSRNSVSHLWMWIWYYLKGLFFKPSNTFYLPLSKSEFALKDINFEVQMGKHIAVIGPNGSGKSTLLAALAGLIVPSKGCVEGVSRINYISGNFTGLSQELTVYENAYFFLIGRHAQDGIDQEIRRVIQFAELQGEEKKLFEHLSSGQKMRLAFALNTLTHSDILILDEVFSVGDGSFRIKSWNYLMSISDQRTFIVATHSMSIVSQLCSQCIVLDKGQIVYSGNDSAAAISEYKLRCLGNQSEIHMPDPRFRIKKLELPEVVRFRDDFEVKVSVSNKFADHELHHIVVKVFHASSDCPILVCDSSHKEWRIDPEKSTIDIIVLVKGLNLSAGRYDVTVSIVNSKSMAIAGHVRKINGLNIIEGPYGNAMAFPDFDICESSLHNHRFNSE